MGSPRRAEGPGPGILSARCDGASNLTVHAREHLGELLDGVEASVDRAKEFRSKASALVAARSPAHFDIVNRRGGSVSVFGSIAVSTPSRYETSAFSASTP